LEWFGHNSSTLDIGMIPWNVTVIEAKEILVYCRKPRRSKLMSTFELGKLRESICEMYGKHEAIDFTPWLVEHIDRLGRCYGLDLEVVGASKR